MTAVNDSQSHAALAALRWQIELGADEVIAELPQNRYEEVATAPRAKKPATFEAPAPIAAAPKEDPAQVAHALASAAGDLAALKSAMDRFDRCDLRKGAKSLVFADGNPAARVMIVGEAPGRDEDSQGLPFVGRAGQLLDRMFEAIGMARDSVDATTSLYITNVLPWRPPQNRDPSPEEVGMLLPFVKRHIELVDHDVLVLMGNHSCQALLGRKGITRLRGNWTEALGRAALPMFHPAYLLRNAHAKRDAWHDLLMLQAKLRTS